MVRIGAHHLVHVVSDKSHHECHGRPERMIAAGGEHRHLEARVPTARDCRSRPGCLRPRSFIVTPLRGRIRAMKNRMRRIALVRVCESRGQQCPRLLGLLTTGRCGCLVRLAQRRRRPSGLSRSRRSSGPTRGKAPRWQSPRLERVGRLESCSCTSAPDRREPRFASRGLGCQ